MTNKAFGCGLVILWVAFNCKGWQAERKREEIMNEHITLYSWVRNQATICIAHVDELKRKPGSSGIELIHVRLQIDETLWGTKGEPSRHYEVSLPASEIARLKFPDPVWGLVKLNEGVRVLLVSDGINANASSPLYVEEMMDPNDKVLGSIREVLREEGSPLNEKVRSELYLRWLAHGQTVEKLFGAEALAKDDLSPVDLGGRVAAAFVQAFESEHDPYTRLSLGTWMWENIYPRTTSRGRIDIINVAIRTARDSSEDVARLSLNHLLEVDPAELRRSEVVSSPHVLRELQGRLRVETSSDIRGRIQRVIEALRR